MRANATLFILSSLMLLLAGRVVPPQTAELTVDLDIIEKAFQSCPESCDVPSDKMALCGCFALNSTGNCTIFRGFDALEPKSMEKNKMQVLKTKLNHIMKPLDMSPNVVLSDPDCSSLVSPRHFLKLIRRLIKKLNSSPTPGTH